MQKEHLIYFIKTGFVGSTPYERGGLFYIENSALTAITQYGSDKLSIHCKIQDCEDNIKIIEDILIKLTTNGELTW